MIASTPTHGGHYLVDVVAGAVLAVVTIMLVKRLRLRDSSAEASRATQDTCAQHPSTS
jgi:membrane-associated phospholipid phosphatase